MKVFSIYRVTNTINNKKYIGFTASEPKQRFEEHRWQTNPKYKNHSYLHRAMFKHGYVNFKFEVIYQSTDRKHALEMEQAFIAEYDTFGENGYNLTIGGEGTCGYVRSQETIEKHRKAITGRKHSEEAKVKIRMAQSGTNHAQYGVAKSQTTKDKIAQAKVGRKWWTNGTTSKASHECPGDGWVLGRKLKG